MSPQTRKAILRLSADWQPVKAINLAKTTKARLRHHQLVEEAISASGDIYIRLTAEGRAEQMALVGCDR